MEQREEGRQAVGSAAVDAAAAVAEGKVVRERRQQ